MLKGLREKVFGRPFEREQRAQDYTQSTLSPEEVGLRRLAKHKKEMRALWTEGNSFDKGDEDFRRRHKDMSDGEFLKSMQQFRRAAIEDPASVLPGSPYGTQSVSQYGVEHERRIKQSVARISAVEKEETPSKWSGKLNRDLVTEGLIVDRPNALKMRAYEMEMRNRQERALVQSQVKQTSSER